MNEHESPESVCIQLRPMKWLNDLPLPLLSDTLSPQDLKPNREDWDLEHTQLCFFGALRCGILNPNQVITETLIFSQAHTIPLCLPVLSFFTLFFLSFSLILSCLSPFLFLFSSHSALCSFVVVGFWPGWHTFPKKPYVFNRPLKAE